MEFDIGALGIDEINDFAKQKSIHLFLVDMVNVDGVGFRLEIQYATRDVNAFSVAIDQYPN
ncbi:hypothetical protein D3C77_455500 [compost metagenome]